MAELMAEGVGQFVGAEVRLKDVTGADHTDLKWCDGLRLVHRRVGCHNDRRPEGCSPVDPVVR